MSKVRVFVSSDLEHDGELYELLLAQSRTPISSFSVLGGFESSKATDVLSERMRRRIREADQLIVICGEHTKPSTRVSADLRIAQQERTPYLLLWDRREIVCTKPIGARPEEGMYSWTPKISQDQSARTFRKTPRGCDGSDPARRDSEERIESVNTISDRTFSSVGG